MLEEDLVKLAKTIRKRKAEWQTTEVKTAAKGCPKRLYDTLSSFSNQCCSSSDRESLTDVSREGQAKPGSHRTFLLLHRRICKSLLVAGTGSLLLEPEPDGQMEPDIQRAAGMVLQAPTHS